MVVQKRVSMLCGVNHRFPRAHLLTTKLTLRVCSDANATAGVVLELGVDGISKRPNTVIT